MTAGLDGIYAGVDPAGLFRSTDGGETWTHVEGLTNHPSRPEWGPGAGGLILHSIVPHPTDAQRMWVGISSVGVFETRDGGETWQTRNQGVRAEFNPADRYPGVRASACTSSCSPRTAGSASTSRTTAASTAPPTVANPGTRSPTDLPTDFGFVMGAAPARPD